MGIYMQLCVVYGLDLCISGICWFGLGLQVRYGCCVLCMACCLEYL